MYISPRTNKDLCAFITHSSVVINYTESIPFFRYVILFFCKNNILLSRFWTHIKLYDFLKKYNRKCLIYKNIKGISINISLSCFKS